MKISIILQEDRNKLGTLSVVDDAGEGIFTCECFGKSDNAAAKAAGNPNRDPLKQFGDVPSGGYNGHVSAPGPNLRSYGPYKRLYLEPKSGQAKEAADTYHRFALMIHGGALNLSKNLRPTHGCVRVSNENMAKILEAIEGHPTVRVDIWQVSAAA